MTRRDRTRNGSHGGNRGRAQLLLVVAAVLAAQLVADVASSPPASAATIHVLYDATIPGSVDPCSEELHINDEGEIRQGPLRACAGGTDRTPDVQLIMDAVAEWYGDIFGDSHEVTIRWAWLGPWTLPDAKILAREAGTGRPVEGRIRIPADSEYFYDPTPHADEEFTMRPRLYRTTHPAEQASAFDGEPPEVLEVSHVGRSTLGPDLVTHVLHEMGHTLGLGGGPVVGPGPACHGTDDPYFRPDPELLGGSSFGIKALPNDKPPQQCVHLDLGGIQECKTDPGHKVGTDPDESSTVSGLSLWECASHQSLFWSGELPLARTRPGVVDLLVLAQAGGWQELNLPRKYTAGPGGWSDPSTWIGNQVPGAADDVYIVNQVGGSKVWESPTAGAAVANLYLSEGNTLRAVGSPLYVGDELRIAGPYSEAGPLRLAGGSGSGDGDGDVEAATALTRVEVGSPSAGGTLRAARGAVESGGALHLRHAAARVETGTLHNNGVILGMGEIRTSELVNHLRVRAVGGTLVIATPESDPDDDLTLEPALLDLDGPGPATTEILAVDGDLLFDGIIADPVKATVTVGAARSIRFTNGWHQEWGGLLVLDGELWPAWVFGHTGLDGTLIVNGVGRFEDDLSLTSLSDVRLSIAGTAMVAEHDFLSVHGLLEIGGTLILELAEGYQPAPLDTFVVASYGSRTGEFTQIVGTELEGGLVLVPDYQDQELVLTAGFAGASPDDRNCKGKAVSEQTAVHGSMSNAAQFHGLTVPELQNAMRAYCGD